MYQKFFKPFFDFVFALLLLLLFLPLLVLFGILITIHFQQSPFFFQSRIGKDEKPFIIWKFRSLSDKGYSGNQILPDIERMNVFGNFLRRTGIDELPQFINILKGEMSFIGPRPLLPEYLPLYTDEIRKRHLIEPGITGLAQVNGGNSLEWEKRFEFDLKYIHSISFYTDLKIIIKTINLCFKVSLSNNIGSYTPQKKS